VLGSTTNVRRITKIGGIQSSTTNLVRARTVAESEDGPVFIAENKHGLRILRGSRVEQFMVLPDPYTQLTEVVSCADYLTVRAGGDVWVWSELTRRWRKTVPPTATQLGHASVAYQLVSDQNTGTSTIGLVSNHNTSGSNYEARIWQQPKEPRQPVSTGGAFDSATVQLAEYNRDTPFRVNKLLVEVDFGRPLTQTGNRVMTASVVTQPGAQLAQTHALSGDLPAVARSTPITTTWTSVSTSRNGHRQMVEVGATNGLADTFTAAPVITMQGLKIRRVIMRCEET
jgi:hypothetical protein